MEKPIMKKKSNTKSVIAERLDWLEGKDVRIRVRSESGEEPEQIVAIYLDTLPVGRAYFFKLKVGGVIHLIQTEQVVEVREVS
jgi:hypothetical protein